MTNAEYDIFIAYKREDRQTAMQLLSVFEAQGLIVFIDTSINAGAHFSVELEQALDASRTVVVLWSEKSKASRYVLDEANEGVERGVLFPVLIENTRIPYGFRGIQTVNLCDWEGDSTHPECESLLNALNAKLSRNLADAPTTSDTTSQRSKKSEGSTRSDEKSRQKSPGDTYRDTLKDGTLGPAMVVIPAGRFLMGSPAGEGRDNERPQHEVIIKEPFAMGQYAVSFAEYDIFCQATDREPAEDDFGRDKQPVINVSWRDAVAYCQWLSDMTGKDYCLPSEARWEYACRAGTTTPWNTGKKLGEGQANFNENIEGTVAVDHYEQPNGFGLFQMHGNVWEWCQDAWIDNYKGAPTDGSASDANSTSQARALRGGSWFSYVSYCRSSYRDGLNPDARNYDFGFRVSCLSPIN